MQHESIMTCLIARSGIWRTLMEKNGKPFLND